MMDYDWMRWSFGLCGLCVDSEEIHATEDTIRTYIILILSFFKTKRLDYLY